MILSGHQRERRALRDMSRSFDTLVDENWTDRDFEVIYEMFHI